jgi:hypothetical protein
MKTKSTKQASEYLGLAAILILLAGLQLYRLQHLAQPLESIWDNVYLWEWARSFGQLDFTTFVADSHHQLRWGNWGFAAILIKFFSDEVIYYYLATVIPSTIAIGIFCYFAWRHIGVLGACLFIVFWYYDALLFRATFQLLPSGAALLPSAIMLLLLTNLSKRQASNTALLLSLSVTMFWLYGTKETHLAFLPAVAWLMFKYGGWRAIVILTAIMLGGYWAETLFFSSISPDFSPLGRIEALVNGGQHVKIMTESNHYVGQQTQYFDSGITMRWMASSGVTPVVLFLAFVVSLLVLGKQHDTSHDETSVQKIIALLIISFFVCSTFFVISISPLRLGHGLVPRYVTILLPFGYLLIIVFIIEQLNGSPLRYKLAMIALLPFFLAPSIHRYSEYPDISIGKVSKNYNKFGTLLHKYECVRAKQRSIVMNQLDFIPSSYRGANMVHMLGNDDNTVHQPPWFIAKADLSKDCESMYTITRNVTMRY